MKIKIQIRAVLIVLAILAISITTLSAQTAREKRVIKIKQNYGSLIKKATDRHNNIEPETVIGLIAIESGGNPRALSHEHAVGLMQIIPKANSLSSTRLWDPEYNINVGVNILSGLVEKNHNNLAYALTAYNRGQTGLKRYLAKGKNPENSDYVKKVVGYENLARRMDGKEERYLASPNEPLLANNRSTIQSAKPVKSAPRQLTHLEQLANNLLPSDTPHLDQLAKQKNLTEK